MSNNLENLSIDVRRSMALHELRRRGLRVEVDESLNDSMVAALKAGISKLPAFIGVSYIDAIQQLGGRIKTNRLTTAETEFLDQLPAAPISGREYALAMWEISEEY